MSGAPRSVAAAAPRAAGAPAAPAVAAVDVGRTPARADVVRLATGKFASNALAFTDCGYVSVEDFRAVAENSGAWPTAGDAGEEAKARSLAQHGLPVKINSRCVLTLKCGLRGRRARGRGEAALTHTGRVRVVQGAEGHSGGHARVERVSQGVGVPVPRGDR